VRQKLDYRLVVLIGIGVIGPGMMAAIYNTFVPIYLQAGNPLFDQQLAVGSIGFGLTATMTGFIMTLDNIAAFFIQPIMGALSDRTRTRFGRRMPYILAFSPVAAIAFSIIPLIPGLIPRHLSGRIDQLGPIFTAFVATIAIMTLASTAYGTPLRSLMPDLIPSALRSKANGVIVLVGSLGGAVGLLGGGFLRQVHPALPFWVAAALSLISVAVLFFWVKEPVLPAQVRASRRGASGLFAGLQGLPSENKRSLLLQLSAQFLWQTGYRSVEAFASSYAVQTLGVSESTAGMLLGAVMVTFVIFAVPSGHLATHIGRKRTNMMGLAIFAVVLTIAYFTPVFPVLVVLLALAGLGFAFVSVTAWPMVLDMAESDDTTGTLTGIFYVMFSLAAVVGPVLSGWVIDLTGRDYSTIFLVSPGFFVLAILCMLGVTKGEAKPAAA